MVDKNGTSINNDNTPMHDKRDLINNQPNIKCTKRNNDNTPRRSRQASASLPFSLHCTYSRKEETMGLKENDEDRIPFQCLLDAAALIERLDEETMRLKQGLNKIDDNNSSGVDTQPINYTTVRIFGTDIIVAAIEEDMITNQPPAGSSKKRKERVESSRAKKPMPKQKMKKHKHKATFGAQPCLPQRFKEMIKCMDGSEEKLIIQKALYKTDLSKHHGRLSIPMNRVEVEFLTDEELKQSSKEGIEALVIEPCLKTRDMSLRIWDMPKPTGRFSSLYVLVTGWKSVVESNDLKVGDVIQVWSFRVNSKLCFALVIVP
uniref:TF-B3 domain-containing protein n=1 Tax=Gossypium raimondii TaxID=29730 RepID=A0A0D2T0A7_GOSRA|nr:hypothetical protein B456_008G045700 [Gossypium raimondii]